MEMLSNAPRLAPITRTWNPLFWFAVFVYRMTTGKTGTPIQVVFSRAPSFVIAHLTLMATAEYLTVLDGRTRALIRMHSSAVNACSFCSDLETHMALSHQVLSREETAALPNYATSDLFSDRERAALRYVEEVNMHRLATDETFAALQSHFTEKEIVHVTWINAVNNYLNLMAKPLGIGSQGYCELPNVGAPAAHGDRSTRDGAKVDAK